MSSPVNVSFSSFIKIDRHKQEPVYLQIVYQFINAVRTNLLEDGDRLPGSRKIAQELQVHRKTVVAALDELQEQGWVWSQPNVGTYVGNPELTSTRKGKSRTFQGPPKEAPYSFRRDFVLDNPFPQHQEKLFFTDGTPDFTVIKVAELARFYGSVLRRAHRINEQGDSVEGNLFFREQLSYYLNVSRGFHLSRQFLLPITGREQVFSILSRLLIQPGDVVLVESLSYFLPNMILGQAGARLRTVPVDDQGMVVDHIQKQFKPGEIRCVYINPRSQYPTTVKLSPARKNQLLRLAQAYDFAVIEDDADFEFSPAKDTEESLFRKDGGHRVIYLGAFGKFLAPGFQMNFLIGPKDLVEEGKKYLNVFGKSNHTMERALGEIIHEGDIHRYQRKSNRVIGERKERFAQLLTSHFTDEISFSTPTSGLAFWVQFKEAFSLTRLQETAKQMGLLIPTICLFQNRSLTALRLGFAHLNGQDMEAAVSILAVAYRQVQSRDSV